MINEKDRAEVEVKADQAGDSIGRDKFIRASEGKFNAQGFRSSSLLALAMVMVVCVGMLFSSKKEKKRHEGKSFPAPVGGREQVDLGTKIMTERDLVNLIPRPKSKSSDLGHIRVVNLRSISEVPIGSEMQAVLVSGATDGIVKAKLTTPLVVDGEPAIPENSVLFGKGKSGEERLMVEFKKVIFPTGEAFAIRAQAFDPSDRVLGLKGAVVGTRTKKMTGAVAFGFLGGMADGMQTTSGSSMFLPQRPSTRDAALAGASKAALDQSQAYMEELRKSPNIIEVKAGSSLVVIVDEPKKNEEGKYERSE
jgi:hypothetical protein